MVDGGDGWIPLLFLMIVMAIYVDMIYGRDA